MLERIVEEIIHYGVKHLFLSEDDVMFVRNEILNELGLDKPYEGDHLRFDEIDYLDSPTPIINKLKEEMPEIDNRQIERIMSFITPMPSQLISRFKELKKDSVEDATSYFYYLMTRNNYIKVDDIKKNLSWIYEGEANNLKITINLSKPEKNNKDIAKLVGAKSTTYPKCLLCYSNVGFYGDGAGKPARSNIRVVPLVLNGEDWFMQYSPYAYYKEHAIVINKVHTPMRITHETFRKLTDFVDEYPNYFIGSNADLPIVGGSILDHEHYQGGLELMPMIHSKTRYEFRHKDYPELAINYLNWYNSAFKLVSNNKEDIISFASLLFDTFITYTDESIDLVHEDYNGRHSTVTPIVRKNNGNYEAYIILRNNRCNEKYPDGIFHAHSQYHNIKKEGIGLIEAMGLFILPPRLKNELELIKQILSNDEDSIREIVEKNPSLEKHLSLINKLVVKYRRSNNYEVADEIVKNEVGHVCENILRNTGIFKDTIDGQLALFNFVAQLNLEVINND